MKRPWQIWLAFLLCLAVVLPAMGWLTHKALELDRAEALAQRRAELEETVSSALWQMDAELAPLLAVEAARPYFVYEPFYGPDAPSTDVAGPKSVKGGAQSSEDQPPIDSADSAVSHSRKKPSPLLMQPSEFVLLNFQVGADRRWTSPQCPDDSDILLALTCGASQENMDVSAERLAELRESIEGVDLLAMVPEQTLPSWPEGQSPWSNGYAMMAPDGAPVVQNTINNPDFRQQIEQQANQSAAQQDDNVQSPQQGVFEGYGVARDRRGQTRQGNDFQSRNAAYQSVAQRQFAEQRLNVAITELPQLANEGVSVPLWVDDQLILARRVQIGGATLVQGCWLDWPAIQARLIEIVSETLPEAELVPVADTTDRSRVHLSRLLATVPARLVVPEASAEPALLSPIRLSLLGAWTFLLLGTASVALLLQGVVSLSERRGAFVSAVTHELRTPLTTFRMYAEMLARGMVPPTEQRQYLETLRVESDRLAHLVENVLEYARLERGRRSSRAESLTLKKLVERVWGRLSDRAAQGEMDLVMELADEAAEATVHTDPRAVDQILFNLVDNACKYASMADDRRLHLIVGATATEANFTVRDHGPGISATAAKKLFRPFSKSVHEAAATAPGVGLGLALSRRLARELGGRLVLASADGPFEGPGAAFTLHLPRE